MKSDITEHSPMQGEVATLSKTKESLIQSSISENTRLAYQRAWSRWNGYRK